MEARLFDSDIPFVSTFEFHKDRERAPHLEQYVHRGRLDTTARFGIEAIAGLNDRVGQKVLVDLGCGDGGFLQLFERLTDIRGRGYDFQPSNAVGWAERGVDAQALNFVEHWDEVAFADVYVITECLEHLADPHEAVRRIFARGAQIICSSPHTETYESHDECHAWAWDVEGYANMIKTAGFRIKRHETVGMFQVIWAA
jgi:hypothetical protein